MILPSAEDLYRATKGGDCARARVLLERFAGEVSGALGGPEARQALLSALALLERLHSLALAHQGHWKKRLRSLPQARLSPARLGGAFRMEV